MDSESHRQLEAALSVMQSRGPDEEQLLECGAGCAMAANRLAIRGPLRSGRVIDCQGPVTVAFNGEIYNHSRWADDAWDGACIAPAYLERGSSAFTEFDGEFAIAIYHEAHDALTLARDPFGCRPLYFSISKGCIVYASHEDAIRQMVDVEPAEPVTDPGSYAYTLTVQEPYTSWNKVWAIPPGHYMTASPRGLRLAPYIDVQSPPVAPERLSTVLEDTLVARLTSTAPVGIALSAGIDSGIIAFTADRLGIPYHVFSVASMLGQSTDESDAIHRRCERLRNALSITLVDCDEQDVERAMNDVYMPGYYASERYDTSMLPTHALMSAVRNSNVRVIIDGAGGDELFHGYPFRRALRTPAGWPDRWGDPLFGSLSTTLLAFTSKTEKAGGAHSLEARYPFQSLSVLNTAKTLAPSPVLKWPLREHLLQRCDYGEPLPSDLQGKHGFGLQNRDRAQVMASLRDRWREERFPAGSARPATPFPFVIGEASEIAWGPGGPAW